MKTQVRNFAKLNQLYIVNKPVLPVFNPRNSAAAGLKPNHSSADWSYEEVMKSTEDHVVFPWGATDPMRKSATAFKRGEGVFLYDYNGKRYYDFSSQAVNNNLGYTVPPTVLDAVTKQLQTLHMTYGGLTITEPKAKLAQLLNDITPAEITGFLFPLSGSEANEVAIRSARRFTGKQKILTRYKSYHGGTTGPLNATGDFRRQFAEDGVSGYVKFLDFQTFQTTWGDSEEKSIANYLAYLEEVILMERANSIAAIMVETISGSSGVLVNPHQVIQGIRALCDKYNILMIADEVMVGMGRTGTMLSFQSIPGVVPDIFTAAKGLTGSFLPLATVGMRKEIQDFFRKNPLGWGTTFQAHNVSCICAYEVLRYMIDKDIVGHVNKMEKILGKRMEQMLDKHNSLRQGRLQGLFGAFDLVGKDGQLIQNKFDDPVPEKVVQFKKKMLENGIFSWVRSPVLHIAPPLIISENELNDGMNRIDDALLVLDH